MLPKFLRVAATELGPAVGVMTEPLAQLSTRRDLLQPAIDRRIGFAQAPRPQAIDQDARAIIRGRWLIDALQLHTAARSRMRGHATTSRSNASSARRLSWSRPTV